MILFDLCCCRYNFISLLQFFQYIEKNVWKGVLKLLQAFIAGFMISYHADDKEGIGSVFQMLELIHTHYTLSELNNNGRKGSKKSNSPKRDSKVIIYF